MMEASADVNDVIPPSTISNDSIQDNDDSVELQRSRLNSSPELCVSCATFIFDILNQHFEHWVPKSDITRGPKIVIHTAQNFAGIQKVFTNLLENGCKVCDLFSDSFKSTPLRLAPEGRTLEISIEAFHSSYGESPTRAMFSLDPPSGPYHFQLYQPVGPQVASSFILPSYVASRCDEPRVFAQARKWMEECHASHDGCRMLRSSGMVRVPLSDTPLPTRVVHVPPGSTNPRLLISNGRRGKYATLSHCWGAAEEHKRIVLSDDTLDAFQKKIPLDSMPATLRDAISFVKAIGIEYIWIDCFGIKQNSKSDWLEESKKMTEIYSNSSVSLCAASARNSYEGLFLDRPLRGAENIRNQFPRRQRALRGVEIDVPYLGRVGVCYPAQSLEVLLADAPIETRAWILQETTLAPAILYFGQESIYWRCSERSASESLPDGVQFDESSSPQKLPTHLYLKDDNATELFLVWYNFVREYARRYLTVPTDRLVAIQGLARRFVSATKSRYRYGLLMSDIQRGLLWHRDSWTTEAVQHGPVDFEVSSSFLKDAARFEEYNAPSWSWGSLICRLSWDWGGHRMPFVNKVDFKYEVQLCDESGHPSEHMCLKGFLAKGHCRLRPARYFTGGEYHEWDDDLIVDFQPEITNSDQASELSCVIDFQEDSNNTDCYLLPISAWSARFRKEKNKVARTVAFYLILVKDKPASTSAGSHYRRIGMGGDYIHKVMQIMQESEKERLVLV